MDFLSDASEETVTSNINAPSPEVEGGAEKVDKTEDVSKWSPVFVEFSQKLKGLATPEEKIALGLEFMRGSISQEGSPRFREFWESRRIVLPFFKENVNSAIRSKLWSEYVELTVEARRLKDILEEQSAFAMEQIDLAIQAVDVDLARVDEILAQSAALEFASVPYFVRSKLSVYEGLQKQLSLYNALASRLNGLRKEIMRTDMRVRFKTKFFKRLSELGDRVFPKRKELIEAVSSEFSKDVDQFVAKHFKGDEVVGAPYYALREEIKSFQMMAKNLTLSSSIFSRTRLLMSECWDKVKVLEKEHKKVVSEKRQASFEIKQAIQTKIDELGTSSSEMSLKDLDKEIDEIVKEMRAANLEREDVRILRDSLAKLRAPHLEAAEKKAKELEQIEQEKMQQRKEKVLKLKEALQQFIHDAAQMELDALIAQYKQMEADIASLEISKVERQGLERSLRSIKDLIADKKENSLLNLSEDDRKTLDNLRMVLQQKKERRQEIKELIDSYRKTLGSSGLDFEKAFHLRELLDQEKERLDKATAGIEEVEQKIAELEK